MAVWVWNESVHASLTTPIAALWACHPARQGKGHCLDAESGPARRPTCRRRRRFGRPGCLWARGAAHWRRRPPTPRPLATGSAAPGGQRAPGSAGPLVGLDQSGQAHVEDLDRPLPIGQQVARLDVPVDDPLLVGVRRALELALVDGLGLELGQLAGGDQLSGEPLGIVGPLIGRTTVPRDSFLTGDQQPTMLGG
jgi:hypothetical protein